MKSTPIRTLTVTVALFGVALASASTARAAPLSGLLSLSPSRADGIALSGEQVGPFTLRNGTDQTFRAFAFPVVIGQRRDGAIFVRQDMVARAEASRLLFTRARPVTLPPGAAYSVSAQVVRLSRDHNLFGGVLFQNTPTAPATGSVIKQVLQINASLFLDPQPRFQRVGLTPEPIRAEQFGQRRLRLFVPVANVGNVTVHASGTLQIATSINTTVASLRLQPPTPPILPGATVELPATLTQVLPAGRYTLVAPVTGRGKRIIALGLMDLFGPNELAVRAAKLVSLPAPTAYFNEPVTVNATFRNTGNLAYAPDAIAELRPTGPAGLGPVIRRVRLKADTVPPGANGHVRGSLELPSRRAYELTVRLLDRQRELDSRSVSVIPRHHPGLLQRILDWISAHPLATLGIFLTILALVARGTALHVRRRMRQ